MFADELHADGHTVGESAGEGQSGDTSRICRDDINIGEIHFERIVCFLAQLERGGGTGGSEENITGSQSSFKVTTKKRAYFLGLEIICVVISSG